MPDLWDPNPDNTSNGPGTKPDSAPNGNNDHTKEVPLRDHRGRLRLPAYVLIALVIALVAILFLLAGALFAPD
jgi:hypothetical protein